MKPKLARSPPAMIKGRAPKRSTSRPTMGPAKLPSALARLNIKAVWVLLSPRSRLMGPKKMPLLWEKMPPDSTPRTKVAASTHQP